MRKTKRLLYWTIGPAIVLYILIVITVGYPSNPEEDIVTCLVICFLFFGLPSLLFSVEDNTSRSVSLRKAKRAFFLTIGPAIGLFILLNYPTFPAFHKKDILTCLFFGFVFFGFPSLAFSIKDKASKSSKSSKKSSRTVSSKKKVGKTQKKSSANNQRNQYQRELRPQRVIREKSEYQTQRERSETVKYVEEALAVIEERKKRNGTPRSKYDTGSIVAKTEKLLDGHTSVVYLVNGHEYSYTHEVFVYSGVEEWSAQLYWGKNYRGSTCSRTYQEMIREIEDFDFEECLNFFDLWGHLPDIWDLP